MHRASDFFIEISGKCNARCPYCARQRFENRYSGHNMSPGIFEKIIDHLFTLEILNSDNASTIKLYNWGEPFLNPGINRILEILKKNRLFADVSSNFIIKPEIDNDLLPVISGVTFSLSGFSQASYGKIHGASLAKVLDNFEDFYKLLRCSAPDTKICISWHRYNFNESEFWQAYKYFNRPGIRFLPTVAYFNDLPEMLDFSLHNVPKARLKQAHKDLFLDHVSQKLDYCKLRSKGYRCFMWDQIVIDENGQLLLCCGMTSQDQEHVLGNILSMTTEEIFRKKSLDPICPTCIASGFPQAAGIIGYKSLPPGGNGNYLKLWTRYSLAGPCIRYLSSKMGRIIKDLPGGGNLFRQLRKML